MNARLFSKIVQALFLYYYSSRRPRSWQLLLCVIEVQKTHSRKT